jgi:hypothetical protein
MEPQYPVWCRGRQFRENLAIITAQSTGTSRGQESILAPGTPQLLDERKQSDGVGGSGAAYPRAVLSR